MKNDLEKATKISNHIKLIMDGTPNENSEEFSNWVNKNKFSKDLLEDLSDNEKLKVLMNNFSNSRKQELGLKLERKIKAKQFKRKIYISSSTIAAAMALILFAVYFSNNENQRDKYSENLQKTTPMEVSKYDYPTIVMSSGETMSMNKRFDSIHIDNGKVEITSTGKEIYDETSNSISQQLIVPKGFKYKINLSDGTIVTVASGSSLKYPIKFGNKEREVSVSGEAFFEVAKDSTPFIVNVLNAKIKVFGTKFNVNGRNTEFVETVLAEGSVGVSITGSDEQKMIFPGQKSVLDFQTKKNSIENINVNKYLSWLSNNFIFEGDDLKNVLKQLTYWYDIKFIFDELENKNIPIIAKYNMETSVEEILSSLEVSTNITFSEIKKNIYYVKLKKHSL